jgi:hypothetical protein
MSSKQAHIPDAPDSYWLKLRSMLGAKAYFKEISKCQSSFLFLGYPHSGHSLVGALIDAHPNAWCSHELDALSLFEQGYSAAEIYWRIKHKSRDFKKSGNRWNGHHAHFQSGSQGTCIEVHAYGDKKGGRSLRRLIEQPDLLERYQDSLSIPLKLIHVYRHPLDQLQRRLKSRMKRTGEIEEKALHRILLLQEKAMAQVMGLQEQFKILHIELEALIADPKNQAAKIFEFLHLQAFEPVMVEFESKVDPNHLETGLHRDWDRQIMNRVKKWQSDFPFLESYTLQ